MYCENVNECFQEINAYCSASSLGQTLIINTENYDDFQEIVQRLEADSNKQCIFVSRFTQKNGLPVIEDAVGNAAKQGTFALIGISQALMLRDESSLDSTIDMLLGLSIAGHTIVLLSHCRKFLEKYMQRDPRYSRRVVLVNGESSSLPQIKLAPSQDVCVGFKPLDGFAKLLSYMEKMGDAKIRKHPALTVITGFKASMFSRALYAVTESEGVFEALCKKYMDLSLAKKEYGTSAQWKWLLTKMEKHSSFASLICDTFGSTVNLISHMAEVSEAHVKHMDWLLWLALKIFGTNGNHYVARVLDASDDYKLFEKNLYTELLKIDWNSPKFSTYYSERKYVIDSLPENLPLITEYCDQVTVHGRDTVHYLTPSSERERYELVKCLATYEYEERELQNLLSTGFPDLARYMSTFVFDSMNTKVPDSASNLRRDLTDYFAEYKQQKLTNRINPSFLETVNKFAVNRPFTSLQPRSSIVAKIAKDKTAFFFFDALGVEYLSFIQAKCEAYGLISEISIGRCELPSLTVTNKEFELTCPGIKKISDLDELKHHSIMYDYTECPYPIHLFNELEIIDTELRRIHSQLMQGAVDKAVILSDHGASRLAVLYGKEVPANIELEEKGLHSGRCCKISEDPHLPQASYEDDYAVMANYERFKGSRKANLEVHGGATLEEVVVPVITLTRKPTNVTYCFVDSVVKFKMGQPCRITLFSNVPMESPKLKVNEIYYEGTFVGDKKHAEFTMPELKRTNTYTAEVYDGQRSVGVTLNFRIERATKQKNLFGL